MLSLIHKITYNGNGNTGGSTAETSFTFGNTASVRANGFTRTGYTFTGWNTKANGSGTAYAAGASYKAAANLTLYAQWKASGYTLKWTGALSSIGSYLGTGSITGSASNEAGKRIVYKDTSGKTAYANPYQAGSITIKQGTAVTLLMVAGGSSHRSTYVTWNVGGSYVNDHDDRRYALVSSSWTPSGSATLTKTFDYRYDDYDGSGYGWGVSAS